MAGLSVRVFRLLQNRQVKREGSRVSDDDVLFGYRLRLFTLAAEIGRPCGLPGDGGPPLDLLPLEAPGRPLGP